MICKNCGDEIEDDKFVCPTCGHWSGIIKKDYKQQCVNCGKEIEGKTDVCPSCGFNPSEKKDFVYCRSCGKKLTDKVSSICPSCGHETGVEKKNYVYCCNCGEIINEDDTYCIKCGYETGVKSKFTTGVLMCIFLNFYGLIVGLLLYPYGTRERKTFLQGFRRAFTICIVLFIIIFLFLIFSLVISFFFSI